MKDYKIIAFDAKAGTITVRFMDFDPFSLDLPIRGGNFIEGEELHQFIEGFLPRWQVIRRSELAVGTKNNAAIEALVEPEERDPVVINGNELSEEVEKIIAKLTQEEIDAIAEELSS